MTTITQPRWMKRLAGASTNDHEATARAIEAVCNGSLVTPPVAEGARHRLAAQFDAMCHALSARIGRVRNNAAIVGMAGRELAQGMQTLAERSTQQEAELAAAAAQIEDVGGIAASNADVAERTNHAATRVLEVVESGEVQMRDAVEQVRRIEQHSREMQSFITAIDGIAFQTNILALNAAVEAARAGEQGRGFAVVASEVRVLAQRSAEAAAQIRRLIDESGAQVGRGVGRIESVHAALADIAGSVRDLSAHSVEIARGSTMQRDALARVLGGVRKARDIAQRNGEMVRESARAAQELDRRSAEMAAAAAEMRLRQGSADEARALVERGCALIAREGLQRAAAAFHDRGGPYFDRDMYIFVFDRQGIFTAFGPRPELAGRHLREIQGLQWERLLQAGFEVADDGGGWVDYSTVNPVTGAVTPKVSYVRPLPGDLLIGCGVYKL